MSPILNINGVDWCNQTTQINSVTRVNVTEVDDVVPPTCGSCDAFNVDLAYEADCAQACVGVCDNYYTDQGPGAECILLLGSHIWRDAVCTPANVGFYSPKTCEACNICYEIDVTGEIINISSCGCEVCLPAIELATSGGDDSCVTPCNLDACDVYYTDGDCAICPLDVGDFLYQDTACTPVADSCYSNKSCGSFPTSGCEWCYCVSGGLGEIITRTPCGGGSSCQKIEGNFFLQSSCANACDDPTCVDWWTDGVPGALQPGDSIYDNDRCECEAFTPMGWYKMYNSDGCVASIVPPQCVLTGTLSCVIIDIGTCGPMFDDGGGEEE